MPPTRPNFLTPIIGRQYRALMYGAEYQTHTDSNSYLHGRYDHDVPCAACYVTQCSTVYKWSMPNILVLVDGPENTTDI